MVRPYRRKAPEMRCYEIVDTEEKLSALSDRMMELSAFALDTETNTLRVNGENYSFLCVCITISWGADNNYYIPMNHRREEDYDRNLNYDTVVFYLNRIFQNDVVVVGHNLKFDLHVLTRIGFHFPRYMKVYDTMLAVWVCDENFSKGLKENSERFFGYSQEHFAEVVSSVPKEVKKEFGLRASSKATYDLVLIDDGAPYALDDSFRTWELYLMCLDRVENEGMTKILEKHMFPFLWTLYRMEERGVVIDVDSLEQMKVDMEKDLDDLMYKMTELVGVEFNPNSSKQLGELLFGFQKTPQESKLMDVSFHFPVVSETATGAPQTNANTLWVLSRKSYKTKRKNEGVEFCKLLMDYKQLEKLKTAFVDGMFDNLYDDGKVHCSFNQVGADSGRLSCQSPNLQQLPNAGEDDKYQIRSLFIGDYTKSSEDEDYENPERKKIIACDFSNLEIRVNAHFSRDPKLLEMFANGDDVHGSTAVQMFELDCKPNECKKKYKSLRQAAKVLNFLLIYGGSAPTLYNSLKSNRLDPIDLGDKNHLQQYAEYDVHDGIDVAQVYIDKYFSAYKGVAKFIRDQHRKAHEKGYVETILKRKRRLPDINSADRKMSSYCERLSVNATIQGSAADITSAAQVRIDRDPWFEEHDCLMLVQVHDELVFECPEEYVEEAIKLIQHYMRYPFGDDYEFVPALLSEADSGNSYAEAK